MFGWILKGKKEGREDTDGKEVEAKKRREQRRKTVKESIQERKELSERAEEASANLLEGGE